MAGNDVELGWRRLLSSLFYLHHQSEMDVSHSAFSSRRGGVVDGRCRFDRRSAPQWSHQFSNDTTTEIIPPCGLLARGILSFCPLDFPGHTPSCEGGWVWDMWCLWFSHTPSQGFSGLELEPAAGPPSYNIKKLVWCIPSYATLFSFLNTERNNSYNCYGKIETSWISSSITFTKIGWPLYPRHWRIRQRSN